MADWQTYYERWQDGKKKIEKYRVIILEQREEIRTLKGYKSCAQRNPNIAHTPEPSPFTPSIRRSAQQEKK